MISLLNYQNRKDQNETVQQETPRPGGDGGLRGGRTGARLRQRRVWWPGSSSVVLGAVPALDALVAANPDSSAVLTPLAGKEQKPAWAGPLCSWPGPAELML